MNTKAILLAAGRGSRLFEVTEHNPKPLVQVNDKPLIEWQLNAITSAGINDITIVTGYMHDAFDKYVQCKKILNKSWNSSNMLFSLGLAIETMANHDQIIVSYSDIIYPKNIVLDLISEDQDIVISYDLNWLQLWSQRYINPLDDAETFKIDDNEILTEIGKKTNTYTDIHGQYMGLLKFTERGSKIWQTYFNRLSKSEKSSMDMTSFINMLIQNDVKIKAIQCKYTWGEVDIASDITLYNNMFKTGKFDWYLGTCGN